MNEDVIEKIEGAIRVVFPKANMESDENNIYVEVPTYSPYYTTHQLHILSEMFNVLQEVLNRDYKAFIKIEHIDILDGIKFSVGLVESNKQENVQQGSNKEEKPKSDMEELDKKVKKLSNALSVVGYDSFSHLVEVKIKESDEETFRKAVSILREKKGRFDKNTKTWTLKEEVLE